MDFILGLLARFTDKHAGEESWQKEIEAHFDSLKNPSLRNSILSLNQVQIKDVRDHGLVRFRAMVQDQLGPELFSAKALLKNVSSGDQRSVTGKYQDELLLGVSSIYTLPVIIKFSFHDYDLFISA